MSSRSCWDIVFHPFSAVVKIQKQFTDDVLENVKKQREVLVKHHREMANRKVELHLDELEEHYLCCVCGTKGLDRDFEPPLPLLNKIGDVPPPVDVKNTKDQRNENSRAVTPTSCIVSEAETSHVLPSPVDGPELPEEENSAVPHFMRHIPPQQFSEALQEIAMEPMDPRDVRNLIEAAKHSIVSAQKLKRLEERHRQKGSYHKDKGLMRIHETDVESFSQFFQKPVRGFLCEACYTCARHRLDDLTREIQQIVLKSKVPFTKHDKALEEGQAVLPDDDIIGLRRSAKCSVCTRRRATYFVRRTVLFLCEFCCAIDKSYRESSVCLNDEPMNADTASILQALAKYSRGSYENWKRDTKALLENQQLSFIQPCTLFSREINLFDMQTLDDGHDQCPSVLHVSPDFATVVVDNRKVGRQTERSLFMNKTANSCVDLFVNWPLK